jgi:hypothetical protein
MSVFRPGLGTRCTLNRSASDIEHAVVEAESAMQRASELVLDGFPLQTETKNHSLPELFSREARSNHVGVDHGDVAVDREIRGGVNPG